MDTWLLLRNVEFTGERNRTIFVRKSRGMAHSNQVREFVLSDKGIDLVDVYLGGDRVLTGSARLAQEAQERAAAALRAQDHQRKLRQLAGKRKAIEAQIAALQAEAEAETEEVHFAIAQETLQENATQRNTDAMAVICAAAREPTAARRKQIESDRTSYADPAVRLPLPPSNCASMSPARPRNLWQPSPISSASARPISPGNTASRSST